LPLLWTGFRLASIFNPKIKEGFEGRKNIFKNLSTSNLSLIKGKKVLIHSSSLGEFQQAIPLIEELKAKNYTIFCSFFSPSGYDHSKIPFSGIVKTYLPFDTISNSRKFLDLIRPEIIILMRYDLWFNLLYEAKKRNIKLVIANARFDHKDKFWNWRITSSFKKVMYKMIDKIFVIDDEDELYYRYKLKKFKGEVIRVGDSKYERVFNLFKDIKDEKPLPEKVILNKKVFVIGSSWKDDEEILLPAIDKALENGVPLLTALVPHEPKETKISAIEKNIKDKYKNIKAIRLSQIDKYNAENLLIIDSIGLLIKLYSISYVSYVGGGFRTGLHNILEPVIFNQPVFFSNIAKNSDEDEVLLETGCGILVENKLQFYKEFKKILTDETYRNQIAERCRKVFENTLGTANRIINNITQDDIR
jgi:3-deoxy-D-manno-octulosonic-acid transferase